MAFHIQFTPAAADHLQALPARQQAILIDGIWRHLAHQPLTPTRNRKPLRPNAIAPWELRIGQMRVFFEIDLEPAPIVRVLQVARKERNQLFIGTEMLLL